jgi:type I restriction enzyme, S subunit
MVSTQVPEGQKQTEVGVIPEDWKVVFLHEVAKKITDGEHATPKRTSEGYYLLSARNVCNSRIDLADVDFVGESEYRRIRKRCDPDAGDILISCSGTVGRVAVLPPGIQCVMVRSAALFKPDTSKINTKFVQYILQSKVGQDQITQSLNQGAQANLFINHIKSLKSPLPPLPEQRSIAQALSDVDALIASLDKLIAKNRHLKTATMQQLLTGKVRLPGFIEKWQAVNINKHASLKARIGWQALTTEEYLDSGSFFLVTGTDFLNGRVNWTTCNFVDEWRYNQDKNIQLRLGDVLLTKDGTIGKVGYVASLPMPATLNSGVFVIRPLGESFHPQFLYYILNSRVFDDFLNKIFAGSTISHLYQKDFVNFEFLAPSLEEQKSIAQVLSDMDTEITALETRRAKTQAIKQGMMQELLTGRTRLI